MTYKRKIINRLICSKIGQSGLKALAVPVVAGLCFSVYIYMILDRSEDGSTGDPSEDI